MKLLNNDKIYLIQYNSEKRIVSTNKNFFELFFKGPLKDGSRTPNNSIETAIELTSTKRDDIENITDLKIKNFKTDKIVIHKEFSIKEDFSKDMIEKILEKSILNNIDDTGVTFNDNYIETIFSSLKKNFIDDYFNLNSSEQIKKQKKERELNKKTKIKELEDFGLDLF